VARYTFGDDDDAIRRLAMVAEAYEPVSRAFVEKQAAPNPSVALDLGCGPGFSTQLLSLTCRPRRLVGLDSSPRFLQSARARLPEARFEQHDITELPFPGAPADLIYARLVLAHLPDPAAVVEGWQGQLAPGGSVLCEELEGIEAPPGPLRDYDELAAVVVRQGQGVMYAGPLLARLGGCCTPVTVDASTAATIYLFNVRRWRGERPAGMSDERLSALAAELSDLERGHDARPVSWIVRQTVLRD
jgi:trans-aconitate 2-methyltransferase